jgi:hypothetical protein
LSYKFTRNVAPYIGVNWDHKIGQTATIARNSGEAVSAIDRRSALLVKRSRKFAKPPRFVDALRFEQQITSTNQIVDRYPL